MQSLTFQDNLMSKYISIRDIISRIAMSVLFGLALLGFATH